MNKKDDIIEEINENIHSETMEEIMSTRYATYAKYVIQDRAIPDARDGLKPVQRRIIYSMYKSGNIFSRPTKKAAHTVGAVMGKYHPHGDTSIYEALVRMSQDWKVNAPLIDFQGNNGSIDGDPPAAYRYTEARLSLIAEEMIRDIEKDTIDMSLTFDDTDFEPVVLPSRFPNLLVNGSEGIAVAMATDIPPHNLKEVIDAIIYRINHVNVTIEDLLNFIPGPDFPTGGIIYNSQSLKDSYLKGRGRLEIASKTEIINEDNKKEIIVTEIPYGTIKINLVYELDKLRHDKILPGIAEVRDESDQKGLRIVIELKKDANVDAIYKYLMNKTGLKSSYSPNMVAIVNGSPKTMNLLDFIDAYIAHQVDVITRRSQYDLNKSKSRLEIVNGLILAISILDEVVEIIRASKDKSDAKRNLCAKFNFSEPQAEAIVMLQLYKLTNTDITILTNEKKDLERTIEYLEGILSDRKKLDRLLISDLKKISLKYGVDRKSLIMDKDSEITVIDKRDLIVKEETIVALSKDGYIKRSSVKSYRSSGDNSLPGLKEGDSLIYLNKAYTTDYLLLFTSLGNFINIPVHDIFENKWKEEGKHINTITSIGSNEKILKAYVIEKFKDDLFFVIASKNGQIKRIALNLFSAIRTNKSYPAIKLINSDEVGDIIFTNGGCNVLLFTENGSAAIFNENEIPLQGLKSNGVKAIAKLNGDKIARLLAYNEEETKGKTVLITNRGALRIFEVSKINYSKRPAKKLSEVFKCFKSEPHKLIYISKIENKDEPTLIRFIDSNKEYHEYKFNDYSLTPMDKYAKSGNIKLSRGTYIDSVFIEGKEYISKDIVSKMKNKDYVDGTNDIEDSDIMDVEPQIKTATDKNNEDLEDAFNKMKEEEEKGYKQVSIFDDTDFD